MLHEHNFDRKRNYDGAILNVLYIDILLALVLLLRHSDRLLLEVSKVEVIAQLFTCFLFLQLFVLSGLLLNCFLLDILGPVAERELLLRHGEQLLSVEGLVDRREALLVLRKLNAWYREGVVVDVFSQLLDLLEDLGEVCLDLVLWLIFVFFNGLC